MEMHTLRWACNTSTQHRCWQRSHRHSLLLPAQALKSGRALSCNPAADLRLVCWPQAAAGVCVCGRTTLARLRLTHLSALRRCCRCRCARMHHQHRHVQLVQDVVADTAEPHQAHEGALHAAHAPAANCHHVNALGLCKLDQRITHTWGKREAQCSRGWRVTKSVCCRRQQPHPCNAVHRC